MLRLDQVHAQLTLCSNCIHGRVADGRPVCGFNGAEIRFFDTSYVCPKGYWRGLEQVFMFGASEPRVAFDEDSQTVWLTRADEGLMRALDAEYARIPGAPLRWTLNGKKPPSHAALSRMGSAPKATVIDPERVKARSYWESLLAKTEKALDGALDLASKATQMAEVMTSGTAEPGVIAIRRASCEACPVRKDAQSRPIPAGVPLGPDQWCGDCGCGTKPWAKLDKKLTYAYLPCPKARPGFSNARGADV